MANRALEILLDRVEVRELGGRKKGGRHMVMATLVWPRPRIAERLSTKTLEFDGNVVDRRESSWLDRIIFKELIDGPFGLEWSVTEQMTDSEIGEFLRFVGSALIKLAGNEAEDLVSNAFGGGLVQIPFQFLSKFIANGGDKAPQIIAHGSTLLHSEETWAKKNTETKTFKVPLTVPETIYSVTRRRGGGQVRVRRRAVLKAGEENGVIEFTGKVYG